MVVAVVPFWLPVAAVVVAPSLVVAGFPLVVQVVVQASVLQVEVLMPFSAVLVVTVQNSVEFWEVPVRLDQSQRALVMTHASWAEYLQ